MVVASQLTVVPLLPCVMASYPLMRVVQNVVSLPVLKDIISHLFQLLKMYIFPYRRSVDSAIAQTGPQLNSWITGN